MSPESLEEEENTEATPPLPSLPAQTKPTMPPFLKSNSSTAATNLAYVASRPTALSSINAIEPVSMPVLPSPQSVGGKSPKKGFALNSPVVTTPLLVPQAPPSPNNATAVGSAGAPAVATISPLKKVQFAEESGRGSDPGRGIDAGRGLAVGARRGRGRGRGGRRLLWAARRVAEEAKV